MSEPVEAMRKLVALIALSSSDNVHEARVACKKARELIERAQIDQGILARLGLRRRLILAERRVGT